MTPTEITAAACRAWAEDEEGKAQRKTRTALDDDEPDAEPLMGWWTGFKCAVDERDAAELWEWYSVRSPELDGSAVHRRFVRAYAAGKAWREGRP